MASASMASPKGAPERPRGGRWPSRMTRSAIVRQHRDIGVVASPLLLIAALTGSVMIFKPMSEAS